MILKRNPKRKHQVVLLLLQIPIESTLFLFSPSVSCSPQILLSVDYIFVLSIIYLLHLHLLHECSHLRSIHQSILSTLSFQTHTHTHIVLNNQQPTNQTSIKSALCKR